MPFAAPRRGDRIVYMGKATGTALSVDGNLCWMSFDDGSPSAPFIWRFKDGLNVFHDWPGKPKTYTCAGHVSGKEVFSKMAHHE